MTVERRDRLRAIGGDAWSRMVVALFHEAWPSRAERRTLTLDDAYVLGVNEGVQLMDQHWLAIHNHRVPRAYFIGLRRGYRLGTPGLEGFEDA